MRSPAPASCLRKSRIRITPPIVPGDANADGNVNAMDVGAIVEFLFDGGRDFYGADVNQDGRVTAAEVVGLIRIL